MNPALARANQQISEISDLPYGLARNQAAEQIVARLEAEGPPEALAYALATLVDSLVWSDEVERAFVPFTRHVRWWDEHPELFDDHDRYALFWSFKWMVGNLSEYPTVPADQIEATLTDMERRYRLEGLGLNAVAHLRVFWAMERGSERHAELYEQWVSTPRDDYSQCRACEPGDRAAYLFWYGRVAEGIAVIEQALTESPSCGTEPVDMLSRLALAYLDTDRLAEAASTHRRCLAALPSATGSVIGPRGRIVEFLGRTGNDAAALRRVEEDWSLLADVTPGDRLGYLRHGGVATGAISSVNPVLPVHVPGLAAMTVAELDGYVRTQADELAAAFDARNGTDSNARALERARAIRRTAEPVDLSVLATETGRPASAIGTDSPDATEPGSPTDPASQEPTAGESALARAVAAADSGDLETAAQLFVRAAGAAENAGRLTDAGMALADAAACAARLHDAAGAAATFSAAVALLQAGGATVDDQVPVLCSWAEAAAHADRASELLPVIEAAIDELDHLGHEPDGSDHGPDPQSRRGRAALLDALARVLATTGERQRAAGLAERAAEGFAGAGATADAAHAFWLAGRIHVELGDPATAVWHLESALEGFTLVRLPGPRGQVAGELITALRAVGRHDDADAVTRLD